MTAPAPRRRGAADRGSITAPTALLTLAVLVFAGLVLDGGLAVAAQTDAVTTAQAAARAGARELDLAALRTTGAIHLDPPAARTAATGWLARAGLPGTVTVTGDTVTVAVTTASRTQLLPLLGIQQIPITATATAVAVQS
jgi:hypothetical protein